MFSMKLNSIALFIALLGSTAAHACGLTAPDGAATVQPTAKVAPRFSWTKVTDGAAFPGAYNFPVFSIGGEMWAFHPRGNWSSTDGRAWAKSELPAAGLNPGYQKYVQLGDAVYALGTMEGNYLNMRLGSRVARTRDFKRWEVVAEKTELPRRVFYGALAFKGKMWLMGGFDGQNYYNDVWSSADGVRWTRVAEHAAWTSRNVAAAVVFQDRMWVLGGGLIDGTPPDGLKRNDVWSSADGINWTREATELAVNWGASPVVYEGQLWLVGANRDGTFTRSVLVTSDGKTWAEQQAPWSPRGAVAVWVFGGKLYMTGGKYSVEEHGQLKFIYSNDVWYMSPSSS